MSHPLKRLVPFRGTWLAAVLLCAGAAAQAVAPVNDDFLSAQILTGLPATASGSSVDATVEVDEPIHGGNSGGASLWWRWTAPVSQSVLVDTLVSDFDTLLGVYTGATIDTLVQVAGNDDAGSRLSRAVFDAVAGTTYHIAVDGYEGASGAIGLRIRGAPIRVAGDAGTIQDAIDAAADGDTILVAAGSYAESIDFRGKDIVVASEHGPAATSIRAGDDEAAAHFVTGEPATAVLEGFTLTHRNFDLPYDRSQITRGSGVEVRAGASPALLGNWIVRNRYGPHGNGAGAYIVDGAPLLRWNRIADNQVPSGHGGGIAVYASSTPVIDQNDIIANHAMTGSALHSGVSTAPIVTRNVVSRNTSSDLGSVHASTILISGSHQGGLIADNLVTGNVADSALQVTDHSLFGPFPDVALTIRNNTFAGDASLAPTVLISDDALVDLIANVVDSGTAGPGIHCAAAAATYQDNQIDPGDWVPGFDCVHGEVPGIDGNTAGSAGFLDPASGDYRPSPSSPLIDSGPDGGMGATTRDLDGGARVTDGDGVDSARIDIGAYESHAVGRFELDAPVYAIESGTGTFTVLVWRRGGADGVASVDVSTVDGSVSAGTGYVAVHETLDFADGEAGPKAVVIELSPGPPSLASGAFAVRLSSPSPGASLARNAKAVVQVVYPTPFPDLDVSAETPHAALELGEPVTVTYTVRNQGHIEARNVVFDVPAESGTQVRQAVSDAGDCWARPTSMLSVRCTIGPIAAGSETTIRVTFSPQRGGTFQHLGTVSTSDFESDDGNNEAVAAVTVPDIVSLADWISFEPAQTVESYLTYVYSPFPSRLEVEAFESSTVLVNGVPTIRFLYDDGSVAFGTLDEHGMRLHRLRVVIDDVGRVTVDMVPPMRLLPALPQLGQTYTSTGNSDWIVPGFGTSRVRYDTWSTVEGVEEVWVPMGFFDALKTSTSMRFRGNVAGSFIDFTQTVTTWQSTSGLTLKTVYEDSDLDSAPIVSRMQGYTPEFTSPAPGAVLAASAQVLDWTANGTPATQWGVQIGSTRGGSDLFSSAVLAADARSVTVPVLPFDGRTLHARLHFRIDGRWYYRDSAYGAVALPAPALTSHAEGDALSSTGDSFRWTSNGVPADGWALWFGAKPGGREYGHALTENGALDTLAFARLPFDGSPVHVTLWWRVNGAWSRVNSRGYRFTAFAATMPALIGPDGDGGGIDAAEPLAGPAAVFTWDDGGTPVQDHAVWFGTTPGGRQYGYAWASEVNPQNPAAVTELAFAKLPHRGETVHATFYWKVNGVWKSRPYTFEAVTLPDPALDSHADGDVLASSVETFTWNDNGIAVEDHAVWFGTTPGGREYGYAWAGEVDRSDPSSVTELTFARLPTSPAVVHATFWWKLRGTWHSRPYTFTTHADAALPSLASSNVTGAIFDQGAMFSGASASFTWDDDGLTVEDHAIWFGTTPGGRQYGYAWARDERPHDPASVSDLTFDRLPTDGSPVHVTFYWYVRGRWHNRRYLLTAAGS